MEFAEAGFGLVAEAETPGSADNFVGEGGFEDADDVQLAAESSAEVVVEGLFFGSDVIAFRVETEGDGVTGGGGFTFEGTGAGGVFCVEPIGVDLCLCGHVRSFSTRTLAWGLAVGLRRC